MADKEDEQTTTPTRGADWEMVSLTASAYAASPGGNMAEFKPENKNEVVEKDKVETSNPLLMSGHFVLPHENSPPKPENTEDHATVNESESIKELGGKSDENEDENWNFKKLTELDHFNTALNLGEKEQSIYCSPKLHSLHNEANMGAFNIDDETGSLNESVQSFGPTLISNSPNLSKKAKEDNHGGIGSGDWWKKQAVSLYSHAKETNTFWSIFAAAAVMGILVISMKERWQVLCHDWKSRIHDERTRILAGPISRIKEAIVGGNRQEFSIRGSTTGER